MQSAFRLDGAAAIPTEWSVGPWGEAVQGSASGALLARALEARPEAAGMHCARLGFEFWRPVPLRPLAIRVEVLRTGRQTATLQATLLDDGREAIRATAHCRGCDRKPFRKRSAARSASRSGGTAPFGSYQT